MTVSSATLQTLDYVFNGQPFVQVPAAQATSTGLDLVFAGQPFSATDLTALTVTFDATRMFLIF